MGPPVSIIRTTSLLQDFNKALCIVHAGAASMHFTGNSTISSQGALTLTQHNRQTLEYFQSPSSLYAAAPGLHVISVTNTA